MDILVRTLASGSSGNALFVAAGETRLLVDAGVGIRHLTRELKALGVQPQELTAILITHEHSDHVRGLERFCPRYRDVPILASRGTARFLAARFGLAVSHFLVADQPCSLGDFTVLPFAISHDAEEPLGLRFECGSHSFAIATDLGVETEAVRVMLQGCRLLVVEANHDLDMLWNGPYPWPLKERIASPWGHLSNDQAARLLEAVAGSELECVVLAHLSQHNNTPQKALQTVAKRIGGNHVTIEAAPRHLPGQPIWLREAGARAASRRPEQLDLPWDDK